MEIIEVELKNRPLLVLVPMRGFNTVISSIWVNTGSIKEENTERGLSHIIEHLVFKGTKKRNSVDIVKDIEFRGGYINAFTSREFTVYYTKMPKMEWKSGIEIISDIVFSPTFPNKECRKEKSVIIEEILNSVDTPDERVFDILHEVIYKDHSLSNPIGGYISDVSSYSRKDILSYYRKYYNPNNLMIVIIGDVDKDKVVSYIKRIVPENKMSANPINIKDPLFNTGKRFHLMRDDISQTHIALASPGFSVYDKERLSLSILNTHIGYGMTSVLFQEIREKLGLAYSIYSFTDFYRVRGLFGLYALTSNELTDKAIDKILIALKRIRKNPMDKNRLKDIKRMITGNIYISSDNISSRMNSIGKSYMYYGKYISPEEVVNKLKRVKLSDVERVAKDVLNPDKFTIITIGRKVPKNFEVLNESKDKKTYF